MSVAPAQPQPAFPQGAFMLSRLLGFVAVSFLFASGCDYPPLPQAVVGPGQSIQEALLRMPRTADTWKVGPKRSLWRRPLPP